MPLFHHQPHGTTAFPAAGPRRPRRIASDPAGSRGEPAPDDGTAPSRRRLVFFAGLLALAGVLPAVAVDWYGSADLATKRERHSATLLLDGRILLAGGATLTAPFALSAAEILDPRSGATTPTAPLPAPRYLHTATLLASGQVLVVGGADAASPSSGSGSGHYRDVASVATAFLFDPETASWTPTSQPPLFARRRHTATLLDSGKVLIAGGCDGACGGPVDAVTAVELFDPADQSFTVIGSLAEPRVYHAATRLADGRVLLVGGSDRLWVSYAPPSGAASCTFQIYDPGSGLLPLANLPAATPCRVAPSGTLLADGRVLVTGGETLFATSGSADLFDPADESWMPASAPSVARYSQTATLLPSGRVLVAGGCRLYNASLEVCDDSPISGSNYPLVVASLYDPDLDQWGLIQDLPRYRRYPTATLLPGGRVLLAGDVASGPSTTVVYEAPGLRLDHSGDNPSLEMNEARSGHAAQLLISGEMLVVGGRSSKAESFDPASDVWSPTANDLAYARTDHSVVLLASGEVFVVGGTSGAAPAELYSPATRSFSPVGAPVPGGGKALLLPTGRVLYVAPGAEPVRSFDPATGTWSSGGALLRPRTSALHAVLLPSGKVLILGGAAECPTCAEVYDPARQVSVATGSTRDLRLSGFATALLPDGRVLAFGGDHDNGADSAELWDPASGLWTLTGPMRSGRSYPTAVLLPTGRLLVAGGWRQDLPVTFEETYDPATGEWSTAGSMAGPNPIGAGSTLTQLLDGRVLRAGGSVFATAVRDVVTFDPTGAIAAGRVPPAPVADPPAFGHGTATTLRGDLRGDAETTGGTGTGSAVDHALVSLQNLHTGAVAWLEPAAGPESCPSGPECLEVDTLPSTLDPGFYRLTAFPSGVATASSVVEMQCGLVVDGPADPAPVAIGQQATFQISSQGGRSFQWQLCVGAAATCPAESTAGVSDGWIDVPGATGTSYTTEVLFGPESGTKVRVLADGGCTRATSRVATLSVVDGASPAVTVSSPRGGEFWLLSDPDTTNRELVSWTMSDDVRICQVRASLLASLDGGATFQPLPDTGAGLPALFDGDGVFGNPEVCVAPGIAATSLTYTIPATPPSGTAGSLYKVRVEVVDHAGNTTTAESPNPFYIVSPNPDSVRTLIFHHVARMVTKGTISAGEAVPLRAKLAELAGHPRVQGLVVDLGLITDLADLYAAWDAAPLDPDRANRVLFGCQTESGGSLPPGCPAVLDGIHQTLRDLLGIYTGVENVVLVGDDSIVPMSRLPDRTVLLPESAYPAGGDLGPDGSPAAAALAADLYLSDDPLATRDPLVPAELATDLFVPDLRVGRLVETAREITATIATFISQDGVVDLPEIAAGTNHRALVTGYDFFTDVSVKIAARWKAVLGVATPWTPVDATLVGGNWGLATTAQRRAALFTHLDGAADGAPNRPYGVYSLNGHANHYGEGLPGENPFDIQGLEALAFAGADACPSPNIHPGGGIDLAGAVLYSIGCHAGLVVPGSCSTDADRSLDLTQAVLGRGALAYVANTGYGWGLLSGIGYGERLVEILTEELTAGGTVTIGEAVVRSKQRYFLENPFFDVYDTKSLQQWTLFGLPMVALRTGVGAGAGDAVLPAARPAVERFGAVAVHRREVGSETPANAAASEAVLPPYLTRVELAFDFSAPGVYRKLTAGGVTVADTPGCPDADGCYYTLNGLVERASGSTDQPLQPYFSYDSRLASTSQHGALWTGATYEEESGWVPVTGTLVSNSAAGVGNDHGAAPRTRFTGPGPVRLASGESPTCTGADLELNSLVVPAGETLSVAGTDDHQRRYLSVGMESLYFNNTVDGTGNCDREGPVLGAKPFTDAEPGCTDPDGCYHRRNGLTLEWAVPAADADSDGDTLPDAEVWRLLVVYTDNTVDDPDQDGRGRGAWLPVELVDDGTGTWRGSVVLASWADRLTYVLQAADTRGNVSWWQFEPASLPASGVAPRIPQTQDVGAVQADLSLTKSDGLEVAVPGQVVTYTIVVSNAGPSAVLGATVADTPPAVLAGATWTCAPDPGATCTAGPVAGPLLDLVNLPPGKNVVYTLAATLAPTATGTVANTAVVTAPAGVTDPIAGNDVASDVDTLAPRPPRVVRLHAVSRPEPGFERAAVTQLLVGFDEPVAGAGSAAQFRVVEADADGTIETTGCEAVAATDREIAVVWATYLAASKTTALGVEPKLPPGSPPAPPSGEVLLPGRYAAFACAGGIADLDGLSLDGDGDGSGGDDARRDFAVIANHGTRNPTFDADLSAWSRLSPSPVEIAFDPQDSDATPTSGSARIVNLSGPGGTYALSQCRSLGGAGGRYRLGGRARIESPFAGGPEVRAVATYFAGRQCDGAALGSFSTPALVGDTGGGWQTFAATADGPPPEAALSVEIRVEALAGSAAAFSVRLDDLVFHHAILFADGFRSGDTSHWSARQP